MNAPTHPTVPLLDLDLLKTLAAIADTGSFSAAAAVVHRTPSAVSMQVKKLEDIVGRPVFFRDSRSVELTSDGAYLLEHARRMLAMNCDVLARFIQPEVQGVVRLGAPDDAAERHLPVMLRRFAESHPRVTVDVAVDHSATMIDQVASGRLDIALITCEAGFQDGSAEILFREKLVWAMCKGGAAPNQVPLPVSVWEEDCVWRQAGIGGLKEQGRAYRIAFQSAHISGQRAAILADLAIAPIPVSSLGGEIVEAPAKYGLPKLSDYAMGMVVAADPNPAIEAAAEHIRESFRQRKIGMRSSG